MTTRKRLRRRSWFLFISLHCKKIEMFWFFFLNINFWNKIKKKCVFILHLGLNYLFIFNTVNKLPLPPFHGIVSRFFIQEWQQKESIIIFFVGYFEIHQVLFVVLMSYYFCDAIFLVLFYFCHFFPTIYESLPKIFFALQTTIVE